MRNAHQYVAAVAVGALIAMLGFAGNVAQASVLSASDRLHNRAWPRPIPILPKGLEPRIRPIPAAEGRTGLVFLGRVWGTLCFPWPGRLVVRMPPFQGGGRGFKSRPGYHALDLLTGSTVKTWWRSEKQPLDFWQSRRHPIS